jgi:hypothetical protein
LAKLPDLDSAAIAAAAKFKELGAFNVGERLTWIGFLRHDDDEWHVATKPETSLSGQLFVITRSDDERITAVPVGSMDNGASILDPDAVQEMLISSRPVFLGHFLNAE